MVGIVQVAVLPELRLHVSVPTCLKTRSQKGHFCSCSRLSTIDGPLVPPPAPELHVFQASTIYVPMDSHM